MLTEGVLLDFVKGISHTSHLCLLLLLLIHLRLTWVQML
jgi:hypothetical protein